MWTEQCWEGQPTPAGNHATWEAMGGICKVLKVGETVNKDFMTQ